MRPGCKIQDYGVIGDCRSSALVASDGSIDWLSWPRFDSPSIFAALLDRHKGGHWSIRPTGQFTVRRNYIVDSNVLQTHFSSPSGRASLTDLMPVASEDYKRQTLLPDHELVRQLVCTEGEVEVEIDFFPRPDYGRDAVRIRQHRTLGLRMEVGRGVYCLHSTVPLSVSTDRARTTVSLKSGDLLQFVLTYSREAPGVLPCLGDELQFRITRSVRWWQQWAQRCSYNGPYREAVVRSALALKLLTYAPSGAITAAATTSLPEIVGGAWNWDYRYCWLRDAALAIRAMLGLGYTEEAESFITWLLHATRLSQPRLRVLYTVFGGNAPREQELDWLDGYFGSRPVRVGNAARRQLQLDIYGEVIEAASLYAEWAGPFDRVTAKVLLGLGKYVTEAWDRPDEGIWEPRSGRRRHTHSRLMCWVALDRLLALHEKGLLSGVPRASFERERDLIRRQIEQEAWNEAKQSYASELGGAELDAALLRLPWYGFEAPDSTRMRKTYARMEQELRVDDGLMYRYRIQPSEGAFGICGYWAVEYLALAGLLDQAQATMSRLLTYRNDLGLLSEEIDPGTGDALGNFPQAFTHVGLISAALSLQEKESGKQHPAAKVGKDVRSAGRAA